MDIMPDFDLIDREYAYDGELGALYSKSQLLKESPSIQNYPCSS